MRYRQPLFIARKLDCSVVECVPSSKNGRPYRLLGEERKSLPTFKMTAFDPDRMKTRASQERAELFSQ
jgi:hypothetical protein